MNTLHLRIFQRQVLDQCNFLLFASDEIGAALRSRDVDRVFYGIQNLLSAGANISKMLWGSKGRRSEDRKRLRESINIEDTSPLRSVDMRNAFEHIDERIDDWWVNCKSHNICDKNIGPKAYAIIGMERNELFRFFDPQTGDVTFWESELNISSMVEEVIRVIPALRIEVEKSLLD